MERARSGSVPASAAGDPAAEFTRAGDFMRRSGPNPGLRSAPPALLEIYDLAGRVEALPGDFAHPATRGHAAGSRRPLVPQCRPRARGAARPRRGGRRRNWPGSPPAAARPPRSCGKPSGRCPARWPATPRRRRQTGRESRVTDRELLDEIYGIVTEPADDHEDVIRRVRALMTGHGLLPATAGERGGRDLAGQRAAREAVPGPRFLPPPSAD